MTKNREFPTIADLPEAHQQPFEEWLCYQTRPRNADGTVGYYQHDYERWTAIQ